jgi:hypothetical protein
LRPSTELEAMLIVRGMLALLLALGFTIRGTWGANGFRGGLQLRWWRALWPVWLWAVPMLALYAGQRPVKEHLQTLAFCMLIGFVEEATSAASCCAISCPAGRAARSCGRPSGSARCI